MRTTTNYTLFTNQWANATSTAKAMAQDFRHLWLTVSTSNTAFTWTIKIKWSRVKDIEDVDFTSAASQTNKWSYIQLTRNDTWDNLAWATWLALTTSSNEVYDLAVNIDWFNYITAELSWYSAWDVTVDVMLYDNQ